MSETLTLNTERQPDYSTMSEELLEQKVNKLIQRMNDPNISQSRRIELERQANDLLWEMEQR